MKEEHISEKESKKKYYFLNAGTKSVYNTVHQMVREDLSLMEFRELWETIFKHLIDVYFSRFSCLVKKNDKNIALGIILRAGLAGLMAAKDLLQHNNIPVFLIWTARKEDENSKNKIDAEMLTCNLPKNAPSDLKVVILEPMCATGVSAIQTMKHLKSHEILEENITFLFGVAAYEGLINLLKEFPRINIIVAYTGNHIGLNEKNYIVYKDSQKSVVGDAGDRWMGITSKGDLIY